MGRKHIRLDLIEARVCLIFVESTWTGRKWDERKRRKRLREAQKFGKDEREEEKRKERRCVLKCSVLVTAPACPLPLFSSRLYPPRLYTKGGGKGVTNALSPKGASRR